MTTAEQRDILQAIQRDNVALFHSLTGKRKALCFGRFPILSICYLYHSRKIVAAYGEVMRGEPTVLAELPEIYNDFTKVCGRALRLWAGYTQHTVHPLEMLAVTGEWRLLRAQYPTYVLSESDQTRLLAAIRLRYGVEARIQDGALILPPKPLTLSCKRLLLALSAAALVVLVAGIAILSVGISYRQGIPIRTAEQLLAATDGKTYALQRDITLTDGMQWKGWTLNGNGHTLTVPVSDSPALVSACCDIRDCTIRLEGEAVTVRESYAMLGLTNTGTWRNVRFVLPEDGITVTLADFVKQEDEQQPTCGFGGLFVTNQGTFANCTIEGNCHWVGQSQVDGQLGAVAAYNYGTIEGCILDGTLTAETMDLGGLVFRNEREGVIKDCTLPETAQVAQTTSTYTWSPMAGGIAAFNYGTIENVCVLGRVACHKENVVYPEGIETINLSAIYAGGVCAHNFGTIHHSVVAGQVEAVGDYTVVYAGGITAEHLEEEEAQSPAILSADIMAGAIYAGGYYIYVGGIAGASTAAVHGCCFNGTLSMHNNIYASYIGSLLGYARFADTDVPTLFQDDHVVQLYFNNMFGTSALPIVGYYDAAQAGLSSVEGVTAHGALDFETLEVYWYGK